MIDTFAMAAKEVFIGQEQMNANKEKEIKKKQNKKVEYKQRTIIFLFEKFVSLCFEFSVF